MTEKRASYSSSNAPIQTIEALKNRPCSLHWTDPNYVPPTPEDITALQNIMGWKAREMGAITGSTFTEKGCNTVRRWKLPEGHRDHQKIHWSSWRMLLMVAGVVSVDDERELIQNHDLKVAYQKK